VRHSRRSNGWRQGIRFDECWDSRDRGRPACSPALTDPKASRDGSLLLHRLEDDCRKWRHDQLDREGMPVKRDGLGYHAPGVADV